MKGKGKDEWATPWPLFKLFDSWYHFDIDVCASGENAKCKMFLTERDNALTVNWRRFSGKTYHMAWCNPPYSDASPWLGKAIEHACKGLSTGFLSHAATGCQWYAERFRMFDRVLLLYPRIAFLGEDGEAVKGNSRDSVFTTITHRSVTDPNNVPHIQFLNWERAVRRGLFS